MVCAIVSGTQPTEAHIGAPNAFSFNVHSVRASHAITIERGAGKTMRQTSTVIDEHFAAYVGT